MKKIPLTQGKFALVDDEDYTELSKYKWYATKGRNTFYAKNARMGRIMHRHILNPPRYKDTDHIDGNGLNNQKINLRLATRSENGGNRRLGSNNTSGFKGVHWAKDYRKWKVRIKINRKDIYLGRFSSREEAVLKYNDAAKKYFGIFARLN